MIKDCNRKFFAYGKFNYPRIKQRGGKQIKGDFFMKMTKKIFLAAIAVAAFAFTGCMDLTKGLDNKKTTGTKYNLTVEASNAQTEGKLFQRGWQQLGTKETVQSITTVISVDTTKVDSDVEIKEGTVGSEDAIYEVKEGGSRSLHAVVGLIFDLHQTKTKEVDEGGKKVTKKLYDFVLVGYRPYDDGFYIEKYKDVTEDAFAAATNASMFASTENTEYITETKNVAFDKGTGNWVESKKGKLGKDDNGKEYADEVPLKKFTVTVTQETAGTYKINMGGKDYTYTPEPNEDWTNKDGYRIGGAGYYVNAPLSTTVKANFNSKNDNTVGLFEEDAE